MVVENFDFRCLRENRRDVQNVDRQAELDNFHRVLRDISLGIPSPEARAFITEAYVRGARVRRAENVDFEGSTAVFTKRRLAIKLYSGLRCCRLPLSVCVSDRQPYQGLRD